MTPKILKLKGIVPNHLTFSNVINSTMFHDSISYPQTWDRNNFWIRQTYLSKKQTKNRGNFNNRKTKRFHLLLRVPLVMWIYPIFLTFLAIYLPSFGFFCTVWLMASMYTLNVIIVYTDGHQYPSTLIVSVLMVIQFRIEIYAASSPTTHTIQSSAKLLQPKQMIHCNGGNMLSRKRISKLTIINYRRWR